MAKYAKNTLIWQRLFPYVRWNILEWCNRKYTIPTTTRTSQNRKVTKQKIWDGYTRGSTDYTSYKGYNTLFVYIFDTIRTRFYIQHILKYRIRCIIRHNVHTTVIKYHATITINQTFFRSRDANTRTHQRNLTELLGKYNSEQSTK